MLKYFIGGAPLSPELIAFGMTIYSLQDFFQFVILTHNFILLLLADFKF